MHGAKTTENHTPLLRFASLFYNKTIFQKSVITSKGKHEWSHAIDAIPLNSTLTPSTSAQYHNYATSSHLMGPPSTLDLHSTPVP